MHTKGTGESLQPPSGCVLIALGAAMGFGACASYYTKRKSTGSFNRGS
jgi:hypothetical protein